MVIELVKKNNNNTITKGGRMVIELVKKTITCILEMQEKIVMGLGHENLEKKIYII